jgi:hypothetical protein
VLDAATHALGRQGWGIVAVAGLDAAALPRPVAGTCLLLLATADENIVGKRSSLLLQSQPTIPTNAVQVKGAAAETEQVRER